MDIIRKLVRSINFAKSWIQLDLTFLVLKGNQQIRDKKAWILSSFPIYFYERKVKKIHSFGEQYL